MVYRKTLATAARRDARRKILLDAATRLFGGYGYHAATVPMIVAEAGSSVGSFYAHFRNKEDVFASVLEALGEQLTDLMEEARVSQADPLLGISRAVESLFMFLAENPREARILIVESSGLSPRLEQVPQHKDCADRIELRAVLVDAVLAYAPFLVENGDRKPVLARATTQERKAPEGPRISSHGKQISAHSIVIRFAVCHEHGLSLTKRCLIYNDFPQRRLPAPA